MRYIALLLTNQKRVFLSSMRYRVLSSAKLQISHSWIKDSKSFIKILNKIGPNIDPCGTPTINSNHLLNDEPIRTQCFLLLR